MPTMHTREGLLLSDTNQVGRRADDHVLPLPELRPSMEGKLVCPVRGRRLRSWKRARCLALVMLLLVLHGQIVDASGTSESAFTIVAFMCVWKRPLLTDFVLSHFHGLKKPLSAKGIDLQLFVTGSENGSTEELARKFSTPYAIHPNSPLGSKHDRGIQSLHAHFAKEMERGNRNRLPDAVAVFGSDDVVNEAFFTKVKALMGSDVPPRYHVIGLRDIYFYDLKSRHLVYTRGYRSYKTQISGTLGCGRVYSWAVLDVLRWHLWDVDRERGLDQSATRNVLRQIPLIDEVSRAVLGRDANIVAIDIKSDGYSSGTNIWRFEEVVEAVGKNGRFHNFESEEYSQVIPRTFGMEMLEKLDLLRKNMARFDSE